MKKKITDISKNHLIFLISVILVLVFHFDVLSQKTSKPNDKDTWQRAAIALNEESLKLNFKSAYGQACANIIIKAHKELLPYPDLPVSNISDEDKQRYRELQVKLQNLRDNPPSWSEIVKKEEEKIMVEYLPPTPPVFIGDVSKNQMSMEKYKNKNRHSRPSGNFKTIEQKQIDTITPAEDEKRDIENVKDPK